METVPSQPTEPVLPNIELSYRRMLESISGCAIFLVDATGRIALWPAGAEEIFGYNPTEAIGRSCEFIESASDRPAGAGPIFTRAPTAGQAEEALWLTRKDGSRFWGEGSITALRDATGQVEGFVWVVRDGTAKKKQVAELEQAKADAEAANVRLVTEVSHELRTPLMPMMIWAQLLGGATAPDRATLDEGLEVIRKCAEEQHELIEKFVQNARAATGKTSPSPVAD